MSINFFPEAPSFAEALCTNASINHHREATLDNTSYCQWAMHKIIIYLEYIPILGTLVALVECAIAKIINYISDCCCQSPEEEPEAKEAKEEKMPPSPLTSGMDASNKELTIKVETPRISKQLPYPTIIPLAPSLLPQVICNLISQFLGDDDAEIAKDCEILGKELGHADDPFWEFEYVASRHLIKVIVLDQVTHFSTERFTKWFNTTMFLNAILRHPSEESNPRKLKTLAIHTVEDATALDFEYLINMFQKKDFPQVIELEIHITASSFNDAALFSELLAILPKETHLNLSLNYNRAAEDALLLFMNQPTFNPNMLSLTLKNTSLNFLQQLPKDTPLTMERHDITNIDMLVELGKFTNFTSPLELRASLYNMKDFGISFVQVVPILAQFASPFVLRCEQFGDAELMGLSGLNQMVSLSFFNSPFSQTGWENFKPCPNLQTLKISHSPVSDEILRLIPTLFPQLTSITLLYCHGITEDGLPPLLSLPLTRVNIQTPGISYQNNRLMQNVEAKQVVK